MGLEEGVGKREDANVRVVGSNPRSNIFLFFSSSFLGSYIYVRLCCRETACSSTS